MFYHLGHLYHDSSFVMQEYQLVKNSKMVKHQLRNVSAAKEPYIHTLEGGMNLRLSGSLIIARFNRRSFQFEYSINDFASGTWYFST